MTSYSISDNINLDLGWKHLDQKKFTLITLLASFSLRLMTYPMSLLKTNRQTQALKSNCVNFENKQSLIRKIYVSQGLRGFYKGIAINLIGNSSHVLYATIYETTREIISNSFTSPFTAPFASGIAGIFASISQLCIKKYCNDV